MLTVYEHLELAKPCDTIFVNKIVNDWQNVEYYLDNEIAHARKNITKKVSVLRTKKMEWSVWGCIEKL